MNDLSFSSNLFQTISYADDTTLYVSLTPTSHLIEYNQIHLELLKVSKWLDLNKVSLNVSEIKCMIFHPHNRIVQSPHIELNGQNIK